ncbi:MAG: hypothetical protein C5B58_10115 [Acidobacteria bacterium]|nr:MAG: hypothetical protein C5B58_10115 [Acidobacteriota bacterium]
MSNNCQLSFLKLPALRRAEGKRRLPNTSRSGLIKWRPLLRLTKGLASQRARLVYSLLSLKFIEFGAAVDGWGRPRAQGIQNHEAPANSVLVGHHDLLLAEHQAAYCAAIKLEQ